jgi:TonB family protein
VVQALERPERFAAATPLESALLAACDGRRVAPAAPVRIEQHRLRAIGGCLLMSALVHAGIVGLMPSATVASPIAVSVRLDARLPLVPGEGPRTHGGREADSPASELEPGGARAVRHNVDASDPGVGGDARGASEIVLLVAHDDVVTLTDAPWNALGPSQTSRIDVAPDRATSEDRRATPRPEDDPFVASGPGEHPERRTPSERDAARGARRAAPASTAGALASAAPSSAATPGPASGALAPESEAAEGTLGRTERGASSDSPGVGIAGGEGTRPSESARVALGRPAVDLGSAATLAEERGRTRDDVDAELHAGRTAESFVESSRRAGERVADGAGGRAAPGPVGSGGGSREGGRARALGTGDGGFESLESDPRYRRWVLAANRRVSDAMVWPRARLVAMDQGTSVFRVRFRRDGTLAARPQLIRSSGFEDLDRAAAEAIAAARFDPVPPELAAGDDELTVTLTSEWWNPMVR